MSAEMTIIFGLLLAVWAVFIVGVLVLVTALRPTRRAVLVGLFLQRGLLVATFAATVAAIVLVIQQ